MTVYHYVQLALAASVAVLAVQRWRDLFRQPTADAARFVSALLRHRDAGRRDEAAKLIASAGDSWLGRVARAALASWLSPEVDPDALSLDEVLSRQRYASSRGMLRLRISMSLGSVSGLLGALYEVVHLPAARRSLLGLVPGLPEQRAFESAMISAGIGLGIAVFAGLVLSRLRRRAKRLYAESLDAAERLEGDSEQVIIRPDRS